MITTHPEVLAHHSPEMGLITMPNNDQPVTRDELFEHQHGDDKMEFSGSRTLLESRGLRTVQRACSEPDCNYRVTRIEIGGEQAVTIDDLYEIAWELYDSMHDDPRPIGFTTLSALIATEGDDVAPLPAIDYLANAVDLGVKHAQNNRAKLDQDQLVRALPSIRTNH